MTTETPTTVPEDKKMSEGAVRGYAAVMALTIRDLCVAAKIDPDSTIIKTPDADGSPGHTLTLTELISIIRYL